MKKIFPLIVLLFFSIPTIFSQEELGEGDIFMQNLGNADTSQQYSSDRFTDNQTVSNYTTSSYEEHYVVDYLFTNLPFEEVKTKAKEEKKAYYIDFTADWCTPCKLMEKTTFRDYDVVNYTKENFYAVQLDMTDFDAIEMQAKYNISSLPTILFFDYNGELIGRTTGLQTGSLFFKKLKEINTFF